MESLKPTAVAGAHKNSVIGPSRDVQPDRIMTGSPLVLKKARATLIDALFEPFRQSTLGIDNRPGPKPERAPLNQPFTRIARSRQATLRDWSRIARCTAAASAAETPERVNCVLSVNAVSRSFTGAFGRPHVSDDLSERP